MALLPLALRLRAPTGSRAAVRQVWEEVTEEDLPDETQTAETENGCRIL